ncbi:MAG TPA: Rieske (2Fe-2S) protein [Anaerolineae bacterium]|nr:Rieske (2Fe-2S) protein [Anaerolineae bacterium]
MILDRRGFIKLTGTTIFCMCGGAAGMGGCGGNPTSDTPGAPAGSYRVENDRVILSLSAIDSLTPIGGAVKFTFQNQGGSQLKVIVVHSGDQEFRAFADRCTHNGKELNYLHNDGVLACCGRSSRFDLAGNVVNGPAEEALVSYGAQIEDVELVITI